MEPCAIGTRGMLAAMLTLAASAPGRAESPLCPEPLRVALYDVELFFNPNSGAGIDAEVIEELRKRTSCNFAVQFNSRVRIWKAMEGGTLELTVSGIATPERRRFADFVPYYRARNELVVLRDAAVPATPEAFLADASAKLAVVKSYKHGPGWDEWIAQLKQRGRVIEVADTRELFHMLDIGRVQGIPIWRPLATGASEQYGPQKPVARLRWFADQPAVDYCLVLSKKLTSPELRTAIARHIGAMRQDGSLKKIYLRYMSNAEAEALLPQLR